MQLAEQEQTVTNKEKTLVIPGQLPGLNEYINAERRNKFAAAKMKNQSEHIVRLCIRQQFNGFRAAPPVVLHYSFYCPNKRRDCDNIAGFAHKVIQDSLVREKVLENDGWKHVCGFTDMFMIDKEKPRIEIIIRENGSAVAVDDSTYKWMESERS